MPHTMPARHPGPENTGRRVAPRWTPAYAETTAGTESRRTAPRAWMTALHAAYQAGLITGASATTLEVAADLASRMDFGTGHVRYCWATVMHNTSLSRATVARHVRILRAAGWLAWVEHGTRANSRAAKGEDGYAGTATVYAATVPPVYDRHAGNRVHGSGYGARVVGVTPNGREDRIAEARDRAATKAADTPSPRVVKEGASAEVEGGSSTARRPNNRSPRATILGNRVTRAMADRAEAAARYVRSLVGWTQGTTLRQLSWALLDLAARGWDEMRMAAWLREQTWRMPDGWRPARAHRFIAGRLVAEQELEAATAARTAASASSTGNAAFWAAARALEGGVEELPDDVLAAEAEELRAEGMRALAAGDPSLIVAMVEIQGLEAARTFYGASFVHHALSHRFGRVLAAV